MKYTRLNSHIVHKSGNAKTVCVTACLTALGVPFDSFHYTGTTADSRRESILRKHGYAVRSRFSKLPKNPTIGKTRKVINKLNDPKHTFYMVIVQGSGYCHCILLNDKGETVVDTDPRTKDKRRVVKIHAVFKQYH